MVSLSQLVLHDFLYFYRHSLPPPNWGAWRRPVDAWTTQLKTVTTLTAQVEAQKVVVASWDAALGEANTTADAAYAARDAARGARLLNLCPDDSILDLTPCPIASACDQRDQVMALYRDEDLSLESLQRELEFQTQRLRDTCPYN